MGSTSNSYTIDWFYKNYSIDTKNETNTASRIHGASGWVIYSIETKEIKAADSTNIEERIIEIK